LAGIPAFLDCGEHGVFVLGEARGVAGDQGDVCEATDGECRGDGDADAGAGAEDLWIFRVSFVVGVREDERGRVLTTRVLPGMMFEELVVLEAVLVNLMGCA
jgi:hypothetical protein